MDGASFSHTPPTTCLSVDTCHHAFVNTPRMNKHRVNPGVNPVVPFVFVPGWNSWNLSDKYLLYANAMACGRPQMASGWGLSLEKPGVIRLGTPSTTLTSRRRGGLEVESITNS